eukprot:scaffold121919_cov21-Tisochrysis_lutea.AAC.5
MALNNSHRSLHTCSHSQQPQPASSFAHLHASSPRSRLPGNMRTKQLSCSRQASIQGESEAVASRSAGPCWHALRAPAIWEASQVWDRQAPNVDQRSRGHASVPAFLLTCMQPCPHCSSLQAILVLLLSDGSVTRHLQLLTSATTKAVSAHTNALWRCAGRPHIKKQQQPESKLCLVP